MKTEIRVQIEKQLKDVYQLPTLSQTYTRLRSALMNPKTSAQEVSSIIEQDQALATKVLKIVNSAFYSFPQQVTTISHATVILGFNEIRNIAFSASVINLFNKPSSVSSFDYSKFWQHSLAVAVCARSMVKFVGRPFSNTPEEAFMAGLIHDVGKITQDQFMHEQYQKVLSVCAEEDLFLREAETKVLGYEHQQVGEYLAENWNLPSVLSAPIGNHNTPLLANDKSDVYPMICVVHVANVLARALDIGWSGDRHVPAIERACWDFLQLRISDVEAIMHETAVAYEELSAGGFITQSG